MIGKTSEFLANVKSELKKVTWPTRKETIQSVVMVFIMVGIAAVFFFSVDIVLAWLVQLALSLGG